MDVLRENYIYRVYADPVLFSVWLAWPPASTPVYLSG